MKWRGVEITPDIEATARLLCLHGCQAKVCEDRGRCLDTWPSCGSGLLKTYFDEAILLLEIMERA